MMAITDFHVTVTRHPDRYIARVTASPVGEASEDFVLPFDAEEARRLSWRAGFAPRDLALIKAPASHANALPLTLEQFGARLFDALFAGKVGQLFFRSLDAAARADRALRVRLQFDDAPEVAELPWEYLYSRDLDRFLVLSTRTPLVRYVALSQPAPSLAVKLPLRVLAILANPRDLPRLDVEQEWTRLNAGVAELVARGVIELVRLEEATLAALRHHLRRAEVHIVHFIGHGDFEQEEGSLLFVDDAGKADKVTAKQVATLLHDHDTLRLVFLNACHGAAGSNQNFFAGVAQKLVQQGVPSVLAMQFAVSDRSAIALAHEFYAALAAGLPLEHAVGEARKAIYSEGEEFEWGTPVLFSRAPDGVILTSEATENRARDDEGAATMAAKAAANRPWWEQLGEAGEGLAGFGSIGATGDVIIASVGAGSRNVAVGKNITQQIYEVVGPPAPDDKQVIAQKFAEVDGALAALEAAQLQMAQGYLELLRGELMKTDEGETPSANTITLVGNWLLEHVPELLEALTSLFATPAVGRVVGKAGEAAVQWVKQRFG